MGLKEIYHSSGILHVDTRPIVEALSESTVLYIYDANKVNKWPCGYIKIDEVILLKNSQDNSVKVGLKEIVDHIKCNVAWRKEFSETNLWLYQG